MDKISTWIFTICVATILVTIVGFFIKDEKLFKGIKMVLSLYIILTALSFNSGGITQIPSLEAPQYKAVAPIDTDRLLREQVADSLVKELNHAFSEGNIHAECTLVELEAEINKVKSVTILAHNDQNAENAKAMLGDSLEKDVEININVGSE